MKQLKHDKNDGFCGTKKMSETRPIETWVRQTTRRDVWGRRVLGHKYGTMLRGRF